MSCSAAQPVPVTPPGVEAAPPGDAPEVEAAPETPRVVFDVRALLGPDVVDLAAFMPGTEALVATIDGEPHYVFRRGDEVFPLIAQADLAPVGACAPIRNVALWSFGDGVAYAPGDGLLFVPVPQPGSRTCWRRMWLDGLAAHVPRARADAKAVGKRSLSVTTQDGTRVTAKIDVSDKGTLKLGRQILVRVPEASPHFHRPDLTLVLAMGDYRDARDPIAPASSVSATAEYLGNHLAIEWQGVPGAPRLIQWRLGATTEDGEAYHGYVEANRLPLKSGAALDTSASYRETTENQHIGTRFEAERSARAHLSFGGETIALWPELSADPTRVSRDDAVPFDVTLGDCRVSVGDPRRPDKVLVHCGETEHALYGPPQLVDESETMKVVVDDHGAFLALEVEHPGMGAGELHRKWLVPKRAGVAVEIFANDLEQ